MPLNRSAAYTGNSKEERSRSDKQCGDVDDFSVEELAYIAQGLLGLLRAGSAADILEGIHALRNPLCNVYASALYCVSEGMGLSLAYGVGDYRRYLPDIVPCGSELYHAIAEERFAARSSSSAIQPTLFDDPISLFCPVHVQGVFSSVVVAVHDPCDSKVLRAILGNAANVIALSCRSDEEFKCSGCTRLREDCSRHFTSTVDIHEMQLNGNLVFTPREQEIMPLLAQGLSNKDMADRLFISPATCKHHVANVFAKLGVHTRAAAVTAWLSQMDISGDDY